MSKTKSIQPKVKVTFVPKKVTKKLLTGLHDRMQTVITERFGLDNGVKKTLEAIGERYGITRERVRQIENAALQTIRKSESFGEVRDVFNEVTGAIEELGGVVEENKFFEMVFPNDVINQNHLHFFLVLGNEFEKVKGDEVFSDHWHTNKVVAENIRKVLKEVHTSLKDNDLLEEADIINRILSHDATKNIPENFRTPEQIRKYLEIARGIGKNALGLWGLSSSSNISARGVKDFAYLVLHNHGGPMHFREIAQAIADKFGRPVHVATCHNTLIADKRFVLIGRGVYGLREWGYEDGPARDVIKRVLQKSSRPMTKTEIVEAVKKERYLKDNTIMVNLQNSRYFKKDSNGFYSIAETNKGSGE